MLIILARHSRGSLRAAGLQMTRSKSRTILQYLSLPVSVRTKGCNLTVVLAAWALCCSWPAGTNYTSFSRKDLLSHSLYLFVLTPFHPSVSGYHVSD